MRSRTTRLKSLSVGIAISRFPWSSHDVRPQAAPRGAKGSTDADPGVCPPLPHEDLRWGKVEEVWRGSSAACSVNTSRAARKRKHSMKPHSKSAPYWAVHGVAAETTDRTLKPQTRSLRRLDISTGSMSH